MRWYMAFGRCIYTSKSHYKVYDNFFFRWLTLDSNILQTVLNKLKPQKPILYYLPAFTLMARLKPDDCCLLGLGGAGVAHHLTTYPIHITAVDNSAEVIAIAQQFFSTNKLKQLSILNQSAELFVQENTTKFAHILVDIYTSHSFPPECANEQFFANCANSLKANGFLSINLASSNDQSTLFQLVRKQFVSTLIIPIKHCSNIVVIACNHLNQEEFLKLFTPLNGIKKVALYDSWGYVAEYVDKTRLG